MSRERFIVATVSGYVINPAAAGTSQRKSLPMCAQVLDRDYCYGVVGEFIPKGAISTGKCLAAATELAARLNARKAA